MVVVVGAIASEEVSGEGSIWVGSEDVSGKDTICGARGVSMVGGFRKGLTGRDKSVVVVWNGGSNEARGGIGGNVQDGANSSSTIGNGEVEIDTVGNAISVDEDAGGNEKDC